MAVCSAYIGLLRPVHNMCTYAGCCCRLRMLCCACAAVIMSHMSIHSSSLPDLGTEDCIWQSAIVVRIHGPAGLHRLLKHQRAGCPLLQPACATHTHTHTILQPRRAVHACVPATLQCICSPQQLMRGTSLSLKPRSAHPIVQALTLGTEQAVRHEGLGSPYMASSCCKAAWLTAAEPMRDA